MKQSSTDSSGTSLHPSVRSNIPGGRELGCRRADAHSSLLFPLRSSVLFTYSLHSDNCKLSNRNSPRSRTPPPPAAPNPPRPSQSSSSQATKPTSLPRASSTLSRSRPTRSCQGTTRSSTRSSGRTTHSGGNCASNQPSPSSCSITIPPVRFEHRSELTCRFSSCEILAPTPNEGSSMCRASTTSTGRNCSRIERDWDCRRRTLLLPPLPPPLPHPAFRPLPPPSQTFSPSLSIDEPPRPPLQAERREHQDRLARSRAGVGSVRTDPELRECRRRLRRWRSTRALALQRVVRLGEGSVSERPRREV